LKKIGKKGKAWIAFRRKYLDARAEWFGGWICSDCKRETMNPDLDHIKTRGSRPDLVFDESNLRIVCRSCHQLKHGIKW
jgi:5-methylcytosine-specific restriction endonuclease McrA